MKTLLVVALLFVAGCNPNRGLTVKPSGPAMPVPEFAIRVSLTQAAGEKLKRSGETIRGAIYFDGDGTPLPNVNTAPLRAVVLGHYEFELREPGELRISDATISQEAYGRLSETNYHFFINVYSGRRAFKNNILNGGYADGRLGDLTSGKPIEIHCGLL